MSLVNVSLQPHRALICVDTAGQLAGEPDSPHYEVSKLASLHAGIVFAVRGVSTTLTLVHSMAASALGGSFDEVSETVPKALRMLPKALRMATKPWSRVPLSRQEVAVVGYCEQAQRMRCVHFTSEDCKEINHYELESEDSMLSPWEEGWGDVLCVDNPEAMRMASINQILRAREISPTAAVGGRLLLVELSRDQMKQTVLHREVAA